MFYKKKLFVKISQYSLENACVGVSFQKKTPMQVFPVDIAKLVRLPLLKNIDERLLLERFNGSLLQRPKVSVSILCASVRLHDPSDGIVFCF